MVKKYKCANCLKSIQPKKIKRLKPDESIAYLNGKCVCYECFNRRLNWRTRDVNETPILFSKNPSETKLKAQERLDLFSKFSNEEYEDEL